MRLLRLFTGVFISRSIKPRRGILSLGGGTMHAEHEGEHGWPEAVPEAEAELVIVVPVTLQPVKVE